MKTTLAAALLIYSVASLASGSAVAADKQDDAKKSKFVSRTYQLTLGSQERCSQPGVESDFNSELARFQKQYSNLMKLVLESPHYSSARQHFASRSKFDPAKDKVEVVAAECRYLASLMRSMIDTEEGQKSAKDIEAALSH